MAKAKSDLLTPQMSYLLKRSTLAYFILIAVLALALANIHWAVFDFLACFLTVHFMNVLCGVLCFKRQITFYHTRWNLLLDLIPTVVFYIHLYH